MNPELTHKGLREKAKIRDGHFINTQKTAGAALTAFGLGISPLLTNNNEFNREFILEKLLDAGKIISLLHNEQLSDRKACITPMIKTKLKPIFTEIKSDEFGKYLSTNLKKSLDDERIDIVNTSNYYRKDYSWNLKNNNRPPMKQTPGYQMGYRQSKFNRYKKNFPNPRSS